MVTYLVFFFLSIGMHFGFIKINMMNVSGPGWLESYRESKWSKMVSDVVRGTLVMFLWDII